MGNQVRRAWLWLMTLTLVVGVLAFYGSSSANRRGDLMVDPELLRSHIQHIATERYTDLALARTRSYLTHQLKTYGYEPTVQRFGSGDSHGTNLSVTRLGSQTPNHKILVGAHYDSIKGSPGADDNASAVAAALEVARIFSTYPTSKTLQVVFFDQEELQPEGAGLLGSHAFVNTGNSLNGLDSVIVLEMLGYSCYDPGCQKYPPGLEQQNLPTQGDFIGVIGDADHPELLAAFATNNEDLQAVTLPVSLGVLPFIPDLFRSDHVPFWLKGIGAVMVTDTAEFRNPNYHQTSDSIESLDGSFLKDTTQYIVKRVAVVLQRGSL